MKLHETTDSPLFIEIFQRHIMLISSNDCWVGFSEGTKYYSNSYPVCLIFKQNMLFHHGNASSIESPKTVLNNGCKVEGACLFEITS